MYNLCILLPTINKERCKNTINQLISLLNENIHLFILNQTFELDIDPNPYVTCKYVENKLGTMVANSIVYENAPEAEYYYFIDDDFEFREGFDTDVIEVLQYMTLSQVHVMSLICNITNGKYGKFFKSSKIRRAAENEIPLLRKESGLILHRDVFLGEHKITAYGEDNAKISHAYLDGYDIYISFVNITHKNNQNHEDSWNNGSAELFGSDNKKLRKDNFYGKLYFMQRGYMDQNQRFTSLAKTIHNYNNERLLLRQSKEMKHV